MAVKKIFLCLALVAAVIIIFFSYRSWGGSFFPYLLILFCPLMHIFMMRGHGKHQKVRKENDNENKNHH